jgi:hypothetical protein
LVETDRRRIGVDRGPIARLSDALDSVEDDAGPACSVTESCGALVRHDDTIISRMAETASERIVRM